MPKGAALAAHLRSADLANDLPLPEAVDALVVGAGMSGLYATWRILDQDSNASVCIFEGSDRTGGRLDSDLIHFTDGSEDARRAARGGLSAAWW